MQIWSLELFLNKFVWNLTSLVALKKCILRDVMIFLNIRNKNWFESIIHKKKLFKWNKIHQVFL